MAERIKGITIEIGGDTTGLSKALEKVNTNIRTTQKSLKDVERLLKIDPRNTELLAQKQKLLGDSVKQTADKLKTLKTAAEQANRALADGKINQGQYDGLKREIIATEQALKKLEAQAIKANKTISSLRNAGNKMTAVGMGMAPISAVSGGLLAGAIKTAADFEQAMSKVGAITKADDKEMEQLVSTAEQLGRSTKFTAKEAADAMSYLGMAGWKTEQIVAGLPAVLKLAGAGNVDLARAADIVSDDLTAFGLSAKDASHMADVYATTITNSNTNIEMMGETMKYAAPVAKAFGITMEETAALTGMMGNAGIKASQAGTSIRGALLRLAGPPKAAAKELDKLGISLSDTTAQQIEARAELDALGVSFDANASHGSKMASILQQLRTKFAGMSAEEQTASAKAIFGANAVSGWLGVLNSGEGDFEKFVNQLQNCNGAVDELYNKMQNNTKGSWTEFQSAVEGLGKSIGDVFLPALTMIIKALTGFVTILNYLPTPVKGFMGALLGLIAIASPVLLTLGQMAIGAAVLLEKFPALAGAGTLLSGVLIKLGAAFGMLKSLALMAITPLIGAFQALWAVILANPITALVTLIVALITYIGYLIYSSEELQQDIINCWEYIKQAFFSGCEAIKNGLNGILDTIRNLISQARNWGADLVDGIADGIRSGIGKVVKAVNAVANAIKSRLHFSVPDEGPLKDYESWMPDFIDGLAKGIKANTGRVARAINGVAETMVISPSVSMDGVLSGGTINITQPLTIDGRELTRVVSQIQYSNGKASLRNLGRI